MTLDEAINMKSILEIIEPYYPYILLWFAVWFCIIIPFLLFTNTGKKIVSSIIGYR